MARVLVVIAAVAFVAAVGVPPLLKDRLRGELWAVLTLLTVSAAIGLAVVLMPEGPSVGRVLITVLQPVGEWLVGPETP